MGKQKNTYTVSLKSITILLILFVGFCVHIAKGQGVIYNPQEDEIYREGEVAVIKITMSADDKSFILAKENESSDVYKLASIRFTNSVIDEQVDSVGVRIRGNTSRRHDKKSFKVSFRAFSKRKFYGYKKFNLKAENNDASMIRELTSLKIFRQMNVPAARSHHAEVYINNEYMGLYLNVENIDDEFVDKRFGSEDGNLYKCHWSADLSNNDRIAKDDIYELKTNEAVNDRQRLTAFVSVLNNTPSTELTSEIEKVLNVETTLRYLAVEAIIGHWDGYSFNQNNFYLYENPETKLIAFIPYDLDNTFGLDFLGIDWAMRNVTGWYAGGNEKRLLSSRLLSIDTYYGRYIEYINELLNKYFSEDMLFTHFDRYLTLLEGAIERDAYYPLKYGFDTQDFIDSHKKQVADHAPYGLRPYVTQRRANASAQLPDIVTSVSDAPRANLHVFPNPTAGNLLFVNHVVTEAADFYVTTLQGARVLVSTLEVKPGSSRIVFRSSPESGIYLVHLGDEVFKLIIE